MSYLEQLFSRLRKRGLVSSARGPGGGYRLSNPAEEISVLDVIRAVDEKVDSTACQKKTNCQDGNQCLSHELWTSLSEQIENYLSGISLAHVIKNYLESKESDTVIKFNAL